MTTVRRLAGMQEVFVWSATCTGCKYHWVAVVEDGADITALQCPSCKARRSLVARSNPLISAKDSA